MTFRAPSAVVAVVFLATPAAAQVSLDTQVSARRVEVNQPFRVQLKAFSDGQSNPANPRLTVPDGMHAQGPSIGTQTEVSITQGRMVQRVGITATWTLTATKPGTFRIGPPSIDVDGKREKGSLVVVQVVPEGQGGRRPGGIPGRIPFDPFDFFDPFGRAPFPRLPFDEPPSEPETPTYPPEYAVDRVLDPVAFLVARAKPQKVVLGQAVNFALYAYGARGVFEPGATTEPSREGFIAYTVDQDQIRAHPVPVEGSTLIAARISQLVLFPIRTGTLRIGPARFGFQGRSYAKSGSPGGLLRESQPIDIVVVEPPLAGRPVGYRLGDVGRYTLTASVTPTQIQQGEAVSVVAKLEGVGNVPPKLNLPQQTGVEWMDPGTIEKIEAENGAVRGSRTFTYVVRIDREGTIDLGEVTLPYYDADKQRYDVARAALGTITVRANPNGAPAPVASALPKDRLENVVLPPKRLRELTPPPPPLSDRRGFWLLLLAGPLGVLTVGQALRVARRLRERWGAEQKTPLHRSREELDAARKSAGSGLVSETAAAIERSVHFALEAATGIRARGVLRSELPRSLAARGVSAELAERVVGVLEAAELARFVQATERGEASELFARGEEVVNALLKGKRG